MVKKTELKEQVVQKFSYRCPYCDQPLSYDEFDLRVGENEIQCVSCRNTYIKIVAARFLGGRRESRSGKARTAR